MKKKQESKTHFTLLFFENSLRISKLGSIASFSIKDQKEIGGIWDASVFKRRNEQSDG